MPTEKTEIETRIEEFADLLTKSGASLTKLANGKTLEEEFGELKQKLRALERRITNEDVDNKVITLERLKEIFGKEKFKDDKYIGGGSSEPRDYPLNIEQDKLTKIQENLKENEWESMSASEIKKELENIRQKEFIEADPLDVYGYFDDDKAIKGLLRFKEVYERVKKAVQVLKQRGEEGWDNEDQKAGRYAGNVKSDPWKKTSVSAKKYYLDLIPKTADNKLNDDEISALKPEEGDWRATINLLVNEEKYSRLDVANLVTYGEDLLSLIKGEKNQKVYEVCVLQEPK